MTNPMPRLPRPRLALLLGLLGCGAFSATAALANPWRPYRTSQLDWVQAQRDWADQSYQRTQRRLDQLEQCLSRARQSWDRDKCLRRDEQARELQWQREEQQFRSLMRRHSTSADSRRPWRPLVGI